MEIHLPPAYYMLHFFAAARGLQACSLAARSEICSHAASTMLRIGCSLFKDAKDILLLDIVLRQVRTLMSRALVQHLASVWAQIERRERSCLPGPDDYHNTCHIGHLCDISAELQPCSIAGNDTRHTRLNMTRMVTRDGMVLRECRGGLERTSTASTASIAPFGLGRATSGIPGKLLSELTVACI